MAHELPPDVAVPDTVVREPGLAPHDGADLMRLHEVLRSAVVRDGSAVQVAVTEGCGTVVVRVSGSTADLRLVFDRAELRNPGYVRYVVREAADRYHTTLGCRPYWRRA